MGIENYELVSTEDGAPVSAAPSSVSMLDASRLNLVSSPWFRNFALRRHQTYAHGMRRARVTPRPLA